MKDKPHRNKTTVRAGSEELMKAVADCKLK